MLALQAITALGFTAIASALPAQKQQGIDWQACPELNKNISLILGFEGTPFDCAKLSVPLDYTDPHSPPLELDLFRVNATKEPVLGSVLINFGGPGGTGAENLPAWAEQMAANIGDQWNLVSWDPRGTGKTLPFNCMLDSTSSALSTETRKRDTTKLAAGNLTAYFTNGGWDYAGIIADQCYAAMNETGQYISSAFVARDMMEIVDALNEDGLLRYYGWSYGTALGSIVSAMFPDRVERVVLDANVNPHDYQAGDYGNFLVDADKALNAFLEECLSNKNDCALAKYTNATTVDDMLNAINVLVQPLATNASTGAEAWTTYTEVAGYIYDKLYYPTTWPQLADTITSILNGSALSTATSTTNAANVTVQPYNLGDPWSAAGIRGADATFRTNSSAAYFPIVQYQELISSFKENYAALWISARWSIPIKEQYTGNFSVKTRHPILYVNGKYDPACPLANAYKASQLFEGGVVLAHSGYGHGIVVDPSACVARYVRGYFENGTLPEMGVICQPDLGPWEMAKAKEGGAA